jgi:hypothetical protein
MGSNIDFVQAISLEEMVNINGGFDEAAYQSGRAFGAALRKALDNILIFW